MSLKISNLYGFNVNRAAGAPDSPPLTNLFGWWTATESYDAIDGGGTIITSNGTQVISLKDLSGNGNHLNRAGTGPTWNANQINGLPSVDFNSSKSVSKTGLSYDTMSWYLVYYLTAIINGDNNFVAADGAVDYNVNNTSTPAIGISGLNQTIAGAGSWYLTAFGVQTHLNKELLVDANTKLTGTIGSTTNYTNMVLGNDTSRFVVAEFLAYDTYHDMTTDDGLLVRQYLNTKYALGLGI